MGRIGEAAERLSQLEARVAKRIGIRVMEELMRRYKVIGAARRVISEWHAREVAGKWFQLVKRQAAVGNRVRTVNSIIERKEMCLAFNRIIEKSTKVSSIARGSEIFTKLIKK
jgi:predicted RNA binding protein with dsRBD fold (UPF0201 family)